MSKLYREVCNTVDVNPTPEELADALSEMDDAEQARFFNALAAASAGWGGGWAFQLQSIINNGILNTKGQFLMSKFGEYAYAEPSEGTPAYDAQQKRLDEIRAGEEGGG